MSVFGGDDDLIIHARVDNDASPELRDIRDELRGVEVQADRTGRTAARSARGFGVMGRAAKVAAFGAKLAFGAALAGGYALVRLLQASFSEAREAQKVGATTAAIIKSTGGAAKVTTKQVARLAERLSTMAGIDDELIQTGANLLLTFKQVRNETGKGNRIFDRATKAAVNLAAAGFGSVESGAKMLGKALNDPLKGVTALSRAGVTFTQVQTDTIAKLVEQGDLLGAQKIILGEVESQVGGVAKAQATWGDKARVTFDNIQERLGTALLPLLDRLARWFVQSGGPQLDHYVGIFENKGIPALKRFAGHAQRLGGEYLPEVRDVLGEVWDIVKDLAPVVGDMLKGFNNLPKWAKTAILVSTGAAVVGKKFGLGSTAGGILGAVSKSKPLPVWVVNKGGIPGVPTTGGGKPTVPPIIPAAGGKIAKFLRSPLGLGGLLTGVTLADRHPEGGWGTPVDDDKVRSEAQFYEDLARKQKAQAQALNQLLVAPLGKVKDIRGEWEFLNDTTAHPKVDGKSLDDTISSSDQLMGLLGVLDRTTAHPRVDVDISGALNAISTVGSSLNNLLGSWGGGTTSNGGGGGKSHDWSNLDGGKHPRETTTPRPAPRAMAGTGGRAGVNVESLIVHAEGANTELDVVDAVGRALDEHFRDRDERR